MKTAPFKGGHFWYNFKIKNVQNEGASENSHLCITSKMMLGRCCSMEVS
jgi:hypothetical protein